MVRDALLPKLVLLASVLAGVSYIYSWSAGLSHPADLIWKGLGVGLLAVYAALKARDLNGWLLAVVMTFGMLGDVLLGVNFIIGAVAFLIGHLVAIGLYLRNRRATVERSQLLFAAMLTAAVVLIAFLLPGDRAAAPGVAFYSLGLALMAATAWTSRFPRFQVGAGALMFVISDLLIFARMGPLTEGFLLGVAIWGLYYFGQLMICVGVVKTIDSWSSRDGAEARQNTITPSSA